MGPRSICPAEKLEAVAAAAPQAEQPPSANSLIDELEKATHEASHERRVQMLRRVTDLFVGSTDKINRDQIELFGDVLGQLISQVESEALGELSARLAPLGNAPNAIIQNLARNDEIVVAGPVLAHSPQLSDHELIEIAQTKSQKHLSSIAERQKIVAAVTDILVERGNAEVLRKVSHNQGAALSDAGFQQLTSRAGSDEVLAENLTRRLDLPVELLQDLITQATETVQARLLAKRFREVTEPREFSRAQASIAAMVENNQLDETVMLNFAIAQQYDKLVVGLAQLSSAPIQLIDQLMGEARHEGILVACKAASLHWPTCRAILIKRFKHRQLSNAEIARARTDFLKLTVTTAQRAIRFWAIRDNVAPHVVKAITEHVS
jgi:uncharacterized protein (DUF2336 family)